MRTLFNKCSFLEKTLRQELMRLTLSITFICLPTLLSAQSQTNIPTRQKSTPAQSFNNSFTIFGTTSIANAHLYGSSSDRWLSFFGLRYAHAFVRRRTLALNYTPEIIPLAILSQPAVGDFAVSTKNPFTHTQISYAVGMNPIGAEFVLLPKRAIQPFIGTTEGFLYFSRNVPAAFAAQFNFSIAVGGGIKTTLGEDKGLDFSYFFHHFSNDFQARENPGLDSHMIRVGYTFAFHNKPH
jgi:hypothetical protein